MAHVVRRGGVLRAEVAGDGVNSRVDISGKPKHTVLTTKWGEDIHAKTIEKRVREAIEGHLAA